VKIYLLGFMASGKSWLGRNLARELGLDFYDLDAMVEEKTGKTISAIFDEEGEEKFREKEREALHSTAELDNCVIATGGGTPCFYDNMQWMNTQGITLFIYAPVELLVKRLLGNEKRPLVKGMDEQQLTRFIEEKLAERLPFYNQSHLCLQPDGHSDRHLEVLVDYLERFI
jgi:shikimate kinase